MDHAVDLEGYLERLKEEGFRLTGPRRVIIETLLENLGRHLNARELMELVQEQDSNVGFATVYRTLELLVGLGMLNRISLEEGFSRYEVPDEKMHFHLYCRFCGKTIHLDDEKTKEALVRSWMGDSGFVLLPQTFEVAGVCSDCRQCLADGAEALAPCGKLCRGRGARFCRRHRGGAEA